MDYRDSTTKEERPKNIVPYYYTVLAYGLSEPQIKMLQSIVQSMKFKDRVTKKEKSISVGIADEYTDIIAFPYFAAFINSHALTKDNLEVLIDFWQQCAEPLSPEMVAEGYEQSDFANPYTCLFNCGKRFIPKISGIYQFADKAVLNREQIYLNILSEIKNNEGLGRKASETSVRIYRVLNMYKCLLQEGKLTKPRADEPAYPDIVSNRMFQRDIRIIREIEDGKVEYDGIQKAYVLKR